MAKRKVSPPSLGSNRVQPPEMYPARAKHGGGKSRGRPCVYFKL